MACGTLPPMSRRGTEEPASRAVPWVSRMAAAEGSRARLPRPGARGGVALAVLGSASVTGRGGRP